MKGGKGHIYEGFVIELTIIEDAVLDVHRLLAKDGKGNAHRIYVYKLTQDKNTQDYLGSGCKISSLNPYYRITTYLRNASNSY
jgi:hypothetical protein